MRKAALSLAAAAIAAGSSLALAGCGAKESAERAIGVDVAQAAVATAQKGTARIALRMDLKGAGLPGTLTLRGTGVTALDRPAGDLTLDLSGVTSSLGLPLADTEVPLRFRGGTLLVQPPSFPGYRLPAGKRWIRLDLKKAAGALGIDPQALSSAATLDAATQLRILKAASNAKAVGEEKVGDVDTTRFRGSYTLADVVAQLPAGQRAKTRKALEQLDALGGKAGGASLKQRVPVDFWVGRDAVLRRMRASSSVPAQSGLPAGTFTLDTTLSDFGAKLAADEPAASTVLDLTEQATKLLAQARSATRTTN